MSSAVNFPCLLEGIGEVLTSSFLELSYQADSLDLKIKIRENEQSTDVDFSKINVRLSPWST